MRKITLKFPFIKPVILFGILILMVTLACGGSTPSPPNTSEDSFSYPIRVFKDGTNEYVPNATVTIEVSGLAPLQGITDTNGFVRIFFDTAYVRKPARILIVANNYDPYRREIDLTEDMLPDTIPLTSTGDETIPLADSQVSTPIATQVVQEPSPNESEPSELPLQPTPAPIASPTTMPEQAPAPVGFFRSCQEILKNGQSQDDDYYTIDPDGAEGRLEPFEVYCDMTRQEGGWTLFAYHTDGIKVFEVDKVTKSEPGVMQGERWRAVRGNMTTGMMFVDESGRVSTLSAAKLNRGNCQNVQNPESLVPSNAKSYIWHDEDSGCGGTGQDYSLIILHGPSYTNYRTGGASLYQWSAEKFDIWPYKATTSYNDQNELFYYIK